MVANIAGSNLTSAKPDLDTRGIVFSTQRYTVHDGPGTRTTVFMKGCTLRCDWCCNPESWSTCPEIGVYSQRCIGVSKCGYCLSACAFAQLGIFCINDDGAIESLDRSLCTGCLACAENCPANALTVWGKDMSVEQVLREVCKDRDFYDATGGGVTISGGEPFVQFQFTLELLKACKREGVHTCVETALGVPWDLIELAMPYIDFIITDIKHMDPEKHHESCGSDLELIMENLKRLGKLRTPSIIRIPLIPNFNDSDENIQQTGRFISEEFFTNLQQVQVLHFHELGKTKFATLGMSYPLENVEKPSKEDYQGRLKHSVSILKSYGLPAYLGTNAKVTR